MRNALGWLYSDWVKDYYIYNLTYDLRKGTNELEHFRAISSRCILIVTDHPAKMLKSDKSKDSINSTISNIVSPMKLACIPKPKKHSHKQQGPINHQQILALASMLLPIKPLNRKAQLISTINKKLLNKIQILTKTQHQVVFCWLSWLNWLGWSGLFDWQQSFGYALLVFVLGESCLETMFYKGPLGWWALLMSVGLQVAWFY